MRSKLVLGLLLLSFLMMRNEVFAQANKTNSGEVTCPSSGGAASIEILAARSARYSYTLNNTSGNDVRIGYLSSGTANLTSSNSWVLKAGQAFADSAPGVFVGRIVCMTNSAASSGISFAETYR